MLTKSKLCYDPATGNGDEIGAFLKTSTGSLTSTTFGGIEALDVNIVGAAGTYLEDDAYVDGGSGIAGLMRRQNVLAIDTSADGDWQFYKSTDRGELYVHDVDANATLSTISSYIDGFTFTGGNLNVEADIDIKSSVADDDPDTENPLKMGSHSRWGALTALSADGDKADLISDKYRRIYVNDSYNVALKQTAQVVGVAASQIAATPLEGRREIELYNNSDEVVYLGFSGAVTTANGFPIGPCASFNVELGQDVNLFAIGSAAGIDVRILEVA